MERLNKTIASSGYCSRRKADELIKEGKVKVNDSVVTELGFKVGDKDQIKVDDILLEKEQKVYYLLNKPRGVVCTTDDDKNRKIITSLIDTIFNIKKLNTECIGIFSK